MAGVHSLLVQHASQLVQVCRRNEQMLIGNAMGSVATLEAKENDGVSIVIDSDGHIQDVGLDSEISQKYSSADFARVLDATGCCVVPGLIDAHTHPVWSGDRVHEFAMKLAGATYMEVHQAGGGIHFTVEHTRKSTSDELYELFIHRLQRMLRSGTTLVECKSGYGLNIETEMKMLEVMERAKRDQKVSIGISSTFCGAHAVPRDQTPEQATRDILDNQLPLIEAEMDSGRLTVDNIDVFCEKSVFNIAQTRRILQAGIEMGLNVNFHGDELHPMGAAELGASMRALAVSHLEEISDDGILAMAESKSIAVILPTTAYILRLKSPPVRKMITAGVPVALGSDFNPNAFCLSMPTVMHLACVNLHMSMPEALCAATINAAAALGKSKTHGSIEPGKRGDLVVFRAPRWEHLIYQFAGHDEIIEAVVCGGVVAYEKKA